MSGQRSNQMRRGFICKMLAQRRFLITVGSAAVFILSSQRRARSQLAALSKLPWDKIFAALQVALTAIPYIRDWLKGDSPEAKVILCKLRVEDIENLEFRCVAVALALDSNDDGPVVPPEIGTNGIIPALADLVAKQDRRTTALARNACLKMLGASESLIDEIAKDYWLSALQSAGINSAKVTQIKDMLSTSRGDIAFFLQMYKAEKNASRNDLANAIALSAQLSPMPLAVQNAITSLQEISVQKIHAYGTDHGSCPP